MFDFGNMFNGMFKPVAKGYCKMGANGKIAIKVQNGYKTFNVKTMKLTNCDNFAFDMDVWRQQDAHRIFGLSDERFFILEGKDRCAISDHLPITIKTSDF